MAKPENKAFYDEIERKKAEARAIKEKTEREERERVEREERERVEHERGVQEARKDISNELGGFFDSIIPDEFEDFDIDVR